ALAAQREQVDVLGAPRLARGEGQLGLLRQGVDGGRLAGVGAADEGDFRHGQRRQLVQLGGGGQKARRVQPAQRLARRRGWGGSIGAGGGGGGGWGRAGGHARGRAMWAPGRPG